MKDKKRCSTCKETKPLDEFSREKRAKDGRRSQCKVCASALQKVYDQTEKRKATKKAYFQTDKGKAAMARYKETNPEKIKAKDIVNNAIKAGKLSKPTECPRCGNSKNRIEGHHKDYSKPLEVEWLCQPCHLKEHP